jgi:hypothetical protein
MGNSNVTQQASASMSVVNNVLQSVSNTCSISCQSSINDITIVVSGSTVGNITIADTCAITGSKCLIATSLDVNITNILTAIFEQKSVTGRSLLDCLGDRNINQNINIEQSVVNNITQLIQNTCNLSSSSSISGVTFIAKNGASVGNFSIVAASSISQSDCSLQNIAQTVLTNKLLAKGKQSSYDGIAAILALLAEGIFAMIIIIVLIATVATVGKTAMGGISKTAAKRLAIAS